MTPTPLAPEGPWDSGGPCTCRDIAVAPGWCGRTPGLLSGVRCLVLGLILSLEHDSSFLRLRETSVFGPG